MKYTTTLFALALILLSGCSGDSDKSDAFGNFEAEELTVSAQTSGSLLEFLVSEGQHVKMGQVAAIIDTTQLHLKKMQLEAGINAIYRKLPNEAAQLAIYNEKIETLNREIIRLNALVSSNAAPSKQLDDLKAELEITLRQKNATASTLSTQTQGMLAEIEPLRYQVLQIEDQLNKSTIVNPIDGVVLTTFVKPSELAIQGRALYKIASLDPLVLRAYVSEAMLSQVKIGGSVTVLTDGPDGNLVECEGTVTWVSSEAEFTPKIIQTRDERVTQVYAVKIDVPNDGSLKIGMPAEVVLGR